MNFNCYQKRPGGIEKWSGHITHLIKHESHYEIRIESRSGITVIFGKSLLGNFACMPDFKAGCYLDHLNNENYNEAKLISAMNPVDGITVTQALKKLSNKIGGGI